MNGGTQDPDTCQCVCPLEYSGPLCEGELLDVQYIKIRCYNVYTSLVTDGVSSCESLSLHYLPMQQCKPLGYTYYTYLFRPPNMVYTIVYINACPFTPDCVMKNCMNGGTQDRDTCNCTCLPEYTGPLCESELLMYSMQS